MDSNATNRRNLAAPNLAAEDPAVHDPSDLGDLERSLLEQVWQSGQLTADQAREQLAAQNRPLKDSTIRTVLRRLEEKGYLTHTVDQRTFLYSPSAPRQAVAGRAVQRIVDWFCQGSMADLLVGMVDSAKLAPEELDRLAERIQEARQQQHPGK